MRILLSVTDQTIARILGERCCAAFGDDANIYTASSKLGLYRILRESGCDYLVIFEDSEEHYASSDILYLAEDSDCVLIPVVRPEESRGPYLQALYAGGILNAVYVGDTETMTVDGVISVMRQPRTYPNAKIGYSLAGGFQ